MKPKKIFNEDIGPVEFNKRIKEYFEKTDSNEITRAGLLLYVGVSKRQWDNLAKNKNYRDGCEYAMTKVQEMYENRLTNKAETTGAIFGLKNLGWSDKNDIRAVVDGDLSLEQMLKGTKTKA